jgi:hypothetical protein
MEGVLRVERCEIMIYNIHTCASFYHKCFRHAKAEQPDNPGFALSVGWMVDIRYTAAERLTVCGTTGICDGYGNSATCISHPLSKTT